MFSKAFKSAPINYCDFNMSGKAVLAIYVLCRIFMQVHTKSISMAYNPGPMGRNSEIDVNEWKMFRDILSLTDEKGKYYARTYKYNI